MESIKANIQATFKSKDTEEWLDIYFNRPLGYLWARLFNHFGIHPNVVTVLSIILGIAAGIMFYYQDFAHNLVGVLLLIWADVYDSCDGQLARMTGKKTHWGRMLDGFAGDTWFITIYLCICLRLFYQEIPFTNVEWTFWIFLLCALAGIVLHTRQCQLADYYRNIHLFFLPGVSSELDSSSQQKSILEGTPAKGNFWWRSFLKSYVGYTHSQEKMTPQFQRLMQYIRQERGGKVPDAFRGDFREKSLPLMKYANFLTFNCRAITLYVACLINLPWLYPVVEITLFSAVALYMHRTHERLCKNFYAQLKAGAYDEK